MKVISWNVNGLRAVLKRDALAFLERQRPDLFCIQETRAGPEEAAGVLPQYAYRYWDVAARKGYSGTAIFCRTEPLEVRRGMGRRAHDSEGRLVTLEYPSFFLVNVYTPNAQRGLTRLAYRMSWDRAFLAYVKRLDREKPVIFCGDLNVAHQEIDLAHPQANRRNAGFTDEEREGFGRLLRAGFVDTFRELCPEGGHYTWWSYMQNARQKNVGWRIDYFCVSGRLRPALRTAFILPEVMGSDHCPVGIEIDIPR